MLPGKGQCLSLLYKRILPAIALILIGAFTCRTLTKPATILYIPLDNRPVNYDYVQILADMTPHRLLLPPRELLNTGERETEPDKIWAWAFEHARFADALVLSLDTLLYGGLVPSRTHQIPPAVLRERLAKLRTLSRKPIFAFGTIMRSAVTADSFGQPDYFPRYGHKLNRLSILAGRIAQNAATPPEQEDYNRLLNQIPQVVLQDYLNRRAINTQLLRQALTLTAGGVIDYLVIGRDDTSPYSFSKNEFFQLRQTILQLNRQNHRADSYPGADEIGALLFARAVHTLDRRTLSIHVAYNSPAAPARTPRYEDIPLSESIPLKLHTLNAQPAGLPAADLVLLVHTREDQGAEAFAQADTPTPAAEATAAQLESLLAAAKPTALADIAFINGADGYLMRTLAENNRLTPLAAYAGWNTAGNSIGTALAQGSLFAAYPQKKYRTAQARALYSRILEDWAYQTVIRPNLQAKFGIPNAAALIPREQTPEISQTAKRELNNILKKYSLENIMVKAVTFPWSRLFDIHFEIEFAN